MSLIKVYENEVLNEALQKMLNLPDYFRVETVRVPSIDHFRYCLTLRLTSEPVSKFHMRIKFSAKDIITIIKHNYKGDLNFIFTNPIEQFILNPSLVESLLKNASMPLIIKHSLVFEGLIKACKCNKPLYISNGMYYKLENKTLYASVPTKSNKKVDWKRTRELIKELEKEFDLQFIKTSYFSLKLEALADAMLAFTVKDFDILYSLLRLQGYITDKDIIHDTF